MIGAGEVRARARRGAKFAVEGAVEAIGVEAIGMGTQRGFGAGIVRGRLRGLVDGGEKDVGTRG